MAGYRIPGSLDSMEVKGGRVPTNGFNPPSASYSTPGPVGNGDLTAQQKELLLDLGQLLLDIVGFFEPTPFADGTNSLISLGRGDWLGAGLSFLSVFPYYGDLAKAGKLPRYARSLSKAIALAKTDVNFARRVRPILQKLAEVLDNVPLSGLPKDFAAQLMQIKNQLKGFLVPVSKRIWSVRKIQDVANQVPLNIGNRQVALYFGLGSDAEKMIPQQYACIGRLLEESSSGKQLLENLKDWNAGGKEGWSILSERLAKKARGSGKPVHVFVNKEFHERMFPDPVKLQQWWKGHKAELIENYKKNLSQKISKQEIRADQIPTELQNYSKKLDKWTQNEIEAQHYAIKGKSKHVAKDGKVRYEDEIFHKIESIHLQSAHFHVMENGQEIKKFLHKFF